MVTIPKGGIEQHPAWDLKEVVELSEFMSGKNISSGDSISSSDRSTITSEHSRNSDNDSCARSPSPTSPLSPLHKRPCQLRSLDDFNTKEELQYLKSVATEVVELKDYAEWFNSLGAEVNKANILSPIYYHKWFSTLGTNANANVVLHPSDYVLWYLSKFAEPMVFVDWSRVNKKCAELALADMKKNNEVDDYEFVRDVEIIKCNESFHLNFFACRRASESSPERGPEKLFFAEVDFSDKVLECCPLDTLEIGEAQVVIHPPNSKCLTCCGWTFSCCSDDDLDTSI